MSRSKVISRLRKLLALARSGDSHETSTARTMADTLMEKHGLTEADASVVGDDEIVEFPLGAKGFEEYWKWKLATVAARYHGCEALGLRVGERRKVRLVGPKVQVAKAVGLFHFFEQAAGMLARTELAGVVDRLRQTLGLFFRYEAERYLRSFRAGVADGFEVSLRKRAREAEPVVVVPASGERVEGLIKVKSRAASSPARERAVSKGARVVGDDRIASDFDLDDFDEVAYRSGFSQAMGISFEKE